MPSPFLLTAATVAPASVAPASVSVVTASGSSITSVSTTSTLPAVSSDTASSSSPTAPGTSSASSVSLQPPRRPALPTGGLPLAPPATPATPSITTASASISVSVSAPSTRPPAASSQRDIAEARQAVDASMANLLDTQLRDRAALMHDNMRAISGQQRDLGRAVAGLRKANDGLARLVHEFTGSYKEMGHVQNWAEMQYQNISVLEETMRLVRERRARQELRRQEAQEDGRDDDDDSWSSSGSYSYSGSYSGSSRSRSASPTRSAAGEGVAVTVDEHVDLAKGVAEAVRDNQGEAAVAGDVADDDRDKGKGKEVDTDDRHVSAFAATNSTNTGTKEQLLQSLPAVPTTELQHLALQPETEPKAALQLA